MKPTHDIESTVNDTLGCLDNIQKASPGHFFFTRLHARLQYQEKNTWEKITSFLARPSIAITILILVLAINGVAIYKEANSSNVLAESTEIGLLDDYNRQVVTFYDPENVNPDE